MEKEVEISKGEGLTQDCRKRKAKGKKKNRKEKEIDKSGNIEGIGR